MLSHTVLLNPARTSMYNFYHWRYILKLTYNNQPHHSFYQSPTLAPASLVESLSLVRTIALRLTPHWCSLDRQEHFPSWFSFVHQVHSFYIIWNLPLKGIP